MLWMNKLGGCTPNLAYDPHDAGKMLFVTH